MNQNFEDVSSNNQEESSRQDAIEELLVNNNELIYRSWELSQRFEEIKNQDLGGQNGLEDLQRQADFFCKSKPEFAKWVKSFMHAAATEPIDQIKDTPAANSSSDLNRILHRHRRSFI